MENGVPEKTKQELFTENPDRFIDIDEASLVVTKTKTGCRFFINKSLSIEQAYIVRGMAEDNMRDYIVIKKMQYMKENSKIVKPKSGFLNGIRGMKK